MGNQSHHYFVFGAEQGSKAIAPVLDEIGIDLVRGPESRQVHGHGIRHDEFLALRVTTASLLHLVWRRDRNHARQSFAYIFVTKGSIAITQHSRCSPDTAAGVYLIAPGDTPVDLAVNPGTEAVVFTFGRDEIGPLADALPENLHLRNDSPIVRTAYASLRSLVRPSSQVDEGTSAVLRKFTKSIAIALAGDSIDQTSPTRTRAFVDVALDLIEQRAHHADVTVDTIAHEVGVSRRKLERGFSSRGLSVAHQIRKARVRHAKDTIDREPYRDLTEVAVLSGFASVSTMRRVFTSILTITPHTAQIEARRPRIVRNEDLT